MEGGASQGEELGKLSLVGAASPVFIVIECSNYESDVKYILNVVSKT